MTHRVRGAFGRVVALGAASLVALGVASATLAAQQTTGKIEGTVTDQQGAGIANAQVSIVGTAFGALTNEKGYYFINNVPVGTYTLRARFIGYTSAELPGVRVFGGQTVTQNVKLTPSAVAVAPVVIEAPANPIVPRDQVTSKSSVTGDLVGRRPIDDVRQGITLQPGVVESGSGTGVSIRGGRPGEAIVYIDGAPVRSTNFGSQAIQVNRNAVEEASVTTGALGVDVGDAQAGLISYTTKAGGTQLKGSTSYESDEPFGDAISVGFNRFEGSLGGPIPRVQNLTFFASGVLQGQVSPFGGAGQQNVPIYVLGGRDTSVSVTDASGNVKSVDVPRFVQVGGQCPTGSADSTFSKPVRQAMLSNYGFECQGRRFPLAWNTLIQLQGKLNYSYGSGSNISITGVANGNQGRNSPGAAVGDPQLYRGFHDWHRLAVVNWSHQIFRTSERALALNVNLSWATDRSIAAPLDAAFEQSSRSPTMGIDFSTVQFHGFEGFPFPITDQIIRDIRTNSGLRTPLLNRTDLRNAQPYRMNPYGLISGGWTTTGFDAGGTLNDETRYRAYAQVDWQANRFHRFNFGAEARKTDLAYWNSSFITQIFMDAYVVHPVLYGAWAADRLDLGDVVLELGARWDYYDSKALFANTPGRIFTNPGWNTALAPTSDTAYQNSLARVFTPSTGHHTLSPHLRVSFPITEQTDFRLSYSHQVQTPDFNTLLSGTNNDLSFTNTNDQFGRDARFGKTILFEFGVRHAFSQDLVLDVAAYNKDKVSDLAYRIVPFDDPANPGRVQNVNILTNADFGYARGVDVKFDRRVGNWLNASVAYTFQVAKNTGSDPFSYLRTSSRQISQVTGDRVPPPEQPLPTDDNRTHNIVGSGAFNVPKDWQKGTTAGAILRDVGAFVTFRAVSGLPYTRLSNIGGGNVPPRQGFGIVGNQIEPNNSSTMPWTKNVDIRGNKGVSVGRTDWTLRRV